MTTVKMPRVEITPDVTQGVVNVTLSKPSQINAGNPSAFPLDRDQFKGLNYQTAANSDLNNQLAEYYAIMNKIMSGQSTRADLSSLTSLTSQIREYVLTDDDYNLVIGALQNMQTYILRFMYQDITNKAKAMDAELNKVVGDVNRFMSDLEKTYSKSPSSYPIPNNSVLRPKLEQTIIDALAYSEGTNGTIMSSTKPANIVGRRFVWFNTGTPLK